MPLCPGWSLSTPPSSVLVSQPCSSLFECGHVEHFFQTALPTLIPLPFFYLPFCFFLVFLFLLRNLVGEKGFPHYREGWDFPTLHRPNGWSHSGGQGSLWGLAQGEVRGGRAAPMSSHSPQLLSHHCHHSIIADGLQL